MPKKKDIALPIKTFRDRLKKIDAVLTARKKSPRADVKHAIHEWAIISAHAALEGLIMETLTTALNRDSSHFSNSTGIQFPSHLTIPVCRYLIVGDGYFGFSGRKDLKEKCEVYLGEMHPFLAALKGEEAAVALEVLAGARNLAAHQGNHAKGKLKKILKRRELTGADGIRNAGSYLSAIDNSKKWRDSFSVPAGKPRIDGIIKFVHSIGNAIEVHVKF